MDRLRHLENRVHSLWVEYRAGAMTPPLYQSPECFPSDFVRLLPLALFCSWRNKKTHVTLRSCSQKRARDGTSGKCDPFSISAFLTRGQ